MNDDLRTHGLWQTTATPSPATTTLQDHVDADVIVIGAGFTGLSTALHLSERGTSVVVIEAVEIGFGGSGRNVGLVNAGMWVKPEVVKATLGRVFGERLLTLLGDAPRLVFDLIKTHGIDCEARHAGTLHCGVGPQGLTEIEERASQWVAHGAPVRVLDAEETTARTGARGFSGALFDPRAGTVQPLGYVRGLARAAMKKGSQIYTNSPALSATRDSERWIVHTPRGSVRTTWVVVATDAYAHGPWDVVRAEQVRLPYFNFATTPLATRVRESILPAGEGAWDTCKVLSSFRLDAAGRLVFGSVGALCGTGARIHEAWARRALRHIFPQLGELTFEAGWFGHIGMTADNLPRFHRFAPNVIGLSGYNGRGIAPGTAFGRVLADLIAGELSQSAFPLPLTEPRAASFRFLKERIYEVGSEVMHLAAARP